MPPAALASRTLRSPLAWWGPLVLVAGVALLYAQTLGFEFVGFDDEDYVSDNPWVRPGLTDAGVRWAFTAFHSGNWHPLTWLSHMADCQAFGAWAGGHHLTNATWHALSSVLVYVWLARLTGRVGPSLVVAALFAWHPLRAESVAWVSERKDVLALAAGLTTLVLYTEYARRGGWGWYLAVCGTFALGLMCKPLLVTLPCVMLLLDYWPLGRVGGTADHPALDRAALPRVLLEKLPLAALVVASSLVTIRAQASAKAVSALGAHPLVDRLGYAVLAYGSYLAKLVWPRGMMFIYPHPVVSPDWMRVAAVGLGLSIITGAAVWQLRARPYLAVGWFWFLGTLVPNIGLVQVGAQFMADRFTYLAGIGLTWSLVWLAADLAQRWRIPASWQLAAAALVAGGYALLAIPQIATWRNTETLVANALAIDPQNHVAHRIAGSVLADEGRYTEAIAHYQQATSVGGRPLADTLTLLSDALAKTGQLDAARQAAEQAVAARPDVAETHRTLGKVEAALARWPEAETQFRRAVELDPGFAHAQADLAVALAEQGRLDEALPLARRAVELRPGEAQFLSNLGALCLRAGNLTEAEQYCREALAAEPGRADATHNLGLVFEAQGDLPAAAAEFARALERDPQLARAEYDWGRVMAAQGQKRDAAGHLARALELRPGWVEPANFLAWLHGTSSGDWVRPAAAVEYAELAARETQRGFPEILDTLAAAYASAGRFDEAAAVAREAVALARQRGQAPLAADIETRLARYQAREPYREP